jgi:hypothetical protein
MDEAEGFFPERRLLAYRRSLLLPADPVPTAAATQQNPARWVLLLCMSPAYIPMGMSLSQPHAPGGHLSPSLMADAYILVACITLFAVLGVCVGIYRGVRTQRLF